MSDIIQGNKASSKRPLDEAEDDANEEEEEEIEDNDDKAPIAGPSKKTSIKSTQPMKKKSKKTKLTPGIVYISRLPGGMTPHKVKHLMGRWGEIGKVYAQRRDSPSGYDPNQQKKNNKKKHESANFGEAWVEFLDKRIAKMVAEMLNAQMIGGKKGDRWRDHVWTMKYLSGFKWEMLGEQIAYERQAHQARLRNEIARSKTEQSEYLKNVELARVLNKRAAKKASGTAVDPTITTASAGASDKVERQEDKGGGGSSGGEKDKKVSRKYKQREIVDRAQGLEQKGMESVLGSIFG